MHIHSKLKLPRIDCPPPLLVWHEFTRRRSRQTQQRYIQIIAPQMLRSNSSFLIPNCSIICQSRENLLRIRPSLSPRCPDLVKIRLGRKLSVKCSEKQTQILRTCKNCKTQFDPLLNHPRACCFHTAHFGGETRRKFESVHSGGTMDTPDSGKVVQYWHCCASEDPFHPGCTAAPHSSYDDS